MSACQAWAVSTSYIDDDGQTQTADATPLTGSETELSGGWYVVNSNITYDHTLPLSGDVRIILADGYTMNVGTSTSR